MQDEEFEWDDEKEARNVLIHRITFVTAREVFSDLFAVQWTDISEDYGEERFNVIGMADNRLLHVSFTLRGERTRINHQVHRQAVQPDAARRVTR